MSQVASRPRTVGASEGEMKTLTTNQVAAGLLNDFIDVEHLEYFHLKPLYEVKAEWNRKGSSISPIVRISCLIFPSLWTTARADRARTR